MDGSEEQANRAHRKPRAGRGAEKKKNKTLPGDEKNDVPKLDQSKEAAKKRNPKAFAVHSAVSMRKMFNRSQDKKTSLPAPMVLLPESEEPPPIVVAIVGPPKVGKSTLMRSLIKVNKTIQNHLEKLLVFSALFASKNEQCRWTNNSCIRKTQTDNIH